MSDSTKQLLNDLKLMSHYNLMLIEMSRFEEFKFETINEHYNIQKFTAISHSDKKQDRKQKYIFSHINYLYKILFPDNIFTLDPITKFVDLKTKLKFFKSELKKLEDKYESIDNLQLMINNQL
jgi:hypothetical protein